MKGEETMEVIWVFNNEEHKKEIQHKLADKLAEIAIERHPKAEIDALLKYAEEGKLSLK